MHHFVLIRCRPANPLAKANFNARLTARVAGPRLPIRCAPILGRGISRSGLEPRMYAKAIERAEHFPPAPTLTQDLEPVTVIQPDRKGLSHWLRILRQCRRSDEHPSE